MASAVRAIRGIALRLETEAACHLHAVDIG
jgi:hypothetical protein